MNNQLPPIKIIWLGFVGTLITYVFVGYQSLSAKNQPIEFKYSDLSEKSFIIAFILGFLLVVIAQFVLPRFLKSDTNGKKVIISLYQFSLSEMVGVMGLVLFFAKGSFTQLIILCSIALVSLLKLFPKE